MAGGVYDVDLGIAEHHGGVFGEDGDAPLPFQIARVHHSLRHLLVDAEHAALAQELVNQGGFAVIDVGDDGDIAQIFTFCHV